LEILFADSPEKLTSDYEVQNWVKEMSKPHSEEGCGIAEMYEQLDDVEQLVSLCTTIISTCSIAHAGSFQQYDAYGFVPNYPGTLKKPPPQTKVSITMIGQLQFCLIKN
jgi:Lipoxygenase